MILKLTNFDGIEREILKILLISHMQLQKGLLFASFCSQEQRLNFLSYPQVKCGGI